MNKKNLFLIAGILSILVFLGYLAEPGPIELLGAKINIWVIRVAWFLIAASNLVSYNKLKQEGK